MPKVYIENKSFEYEKMFLAMGWTVTRSLKEADLVQFTGGSDVTPTLYGEYPHPTTDYNIERDKREIVVYKIAQGLEIPCAGICRGGQFLNVMCGGRMWQNVNNHSYAAGHDVVDIETGAYFDVSSTHHQMMRPTKDAVVLAYAWESTKREHMGGEKNIITEEFLLKENDGDPEILFYEEQEVICFQPHPEFIGMPKLRDRYFGYLYSYLVPQHAPKDFVFNDGVICEG